MALGRGEGATR